MSIITAAELKASGTQNAMQAIQSLRPAWLRARQSGGTTRSGTRVSGSPSSAIVVYIDNVKYGTLDALQQVPVSSVTEIHYFSPSEATTHFGAGHPAGAIALTTLK